MGERAEGQRELFRGELRLQPDLFVPPPRRLRPDLPDIRLECWRDGTAILMCLTGRGERTVRSLLGKMLKLARDDVPLVMKCLHDAVDLRPMLPVQWIVGAIRSRCDKGSESESEKLRQEWSLGSVLDGD